MADDVLAGILGGISGGLEGFVSASQLRKMNEQEVREAAESAARLRASEAAIHTSELRARDAQNALDLHAALGGTEGQKVEILRVRDVAIEEANDANLSRDQARAALEGVGNRATQGENERRFDRFVEFYSDNPEAITSLSPAGKSAFDSATDLGRRGDFDFANPEHAAFLDILDRETVPQHLEDQEFGPPQQQDPTTFFAEKTIRDVEAGEEAAGRAARIQALQSFGNFLDPENENDRALLETITQTLATDLGLIDPELVSQTDAEVLDEEEGLIGAGVRLAGAQPVKALREAVLSKEAIEFEESLLNILEARKATERPNIAEFAGRLSGGPSNVPKFGDLGRLFGGPGEEEEGAILSEFATDLPESMRDDIIADLSGDERKDFTRLDEQGQRVFLLKKAIDSPSIILAASSINALRKGSAFGGTGSDATSIELILKMLSAIPGVSKIPGVAKFTKAAKETVSKAREGVRALTPSGRVAQGATRETEALKFLEQSVGSDIGAFAQAIGKGRPVPPPIPQAQRLLPAPRVSQRPGTSAVPAARVPRATPTRQTGPTIELPPPGQTLPPPATLEQLLQRTPQDIQAEELFRRILFGGVSP